MFLRGADASHKNVTINYQDKMSLQNVTTNCHNKLLRQIRAKLSLHGFDTYR